MNKKIIKQLFKKEMLDVLRDKKTVLMMVVVPLIIYPLIMILSMQVMSGVTEDMAKSTYSIAISGDNVQEYVELFQNIKEESYSIEVVVADELDVDLQQGNIDLYLKIDGGDEATDRIDICYLSASSRSNYAVDVVLDVLGKYSAEKTEDMLLDAGLNPEEVLNPVKISYVDKSTAEESTGSLLGSILPFMLVVSILMGTMYPAIDTTSGEKERGTLETVLTLPISGKELIFSKFLAVGVFGIASALLNMLSMCGVMAYMFNMMKKMGVDALAEVSISKFVPPLIIGILCVFAFAIFVSALSMCVCAFAKSYKEANNYITPVTLVVMMASFISFIPNVELTKTMSLVPVANLCLLLRDLLVFKFNYINVLLVLFSNIAYGVVSVLILGRIYNSESIMFGDGQSGIQLFERRCNMKKGGVPTLGDCGFVVILMTLIYLYVGSSLQLEFGMKGLVASQLLFVLVPLLIAVYSKKSIRETFKLKLCKPRKMVGGILLGIGSIAWGLVIAAISTRIFPESADASQQGLEAYMPDSFLVGLLVFAVTPAICEEMFFRGYVFSALENKLKISTAIILNGALFGVFHMSLAKFFTTGFLGGVMAYLGYKSRSILPGMIMHFCNNALACIVMYHSAELIEGLAFLNMNTMMDVTISAVVILLVVIIFPIVGYGLLNGKEVDY